MIWIISKNFTKNNNFLEGFRTSAKTGFNIDESMKFLVEKIIEKMNNTTKNDSINVERNSKFLISSKNKSIQSFRIKEKKGCC